ncbi:MAG: YbcC family protein [Methylococcaceae bacterium]
MTKPPPKIILDDYLKLHTFDLDEAIDHIAHWLPTQGPIKDFIHHNTLHAVQHYPFHKGVAIAAKVFGARSYLPVADYQAMYRQGRIKDFAIDWAIKQSGYTPDHFPLLRNNLFIVDHTKHYPPVSLANHGIRNSWLTGLEVDLNSLVHPILFRLLANFLDQGISRWTLAKPGESFWECVWRLAQNSLLPLYPFHDPAVRELLNQSPDEVIQACLQRIVGSEALYEQYLLEMILAHPGWSGMVRLIELDPKSLLERRQISLKEMIAVELVAELAILSKKRGADFITIAAMPHSSEIPLLCDYEAKAVVPLTLKIWHEAMEYSLHAELLTALKAQDAPVKTKEPPIAQAFFCFDDRECSLRRYLEEINPAIETFGAAGFFGIDFLYQGFDDAYPVAQCPNILSPKHLIMESNLQLEVEKNDLTEGLSDLHIKPHSLFRGWLFTQILGIAYAARMLWDVFRPGSQLLKIKKLSEVEAHTHLHLLRESDEPTEDGKLLGFSFTEMADKIEGLLRNIGLTQNFAPLVVVVAHGSSSTNNPHFAAYDCGACSGKPGAPNARAFAWMANHESVRDILRERGIDIPPTSHFVAALHNTSRDEITYYDKHLFAQYPADGLQTFQQAMQEALQKNALERCRWFELGPESHSHDEAHEHVINRASSIFEPRPELNHSNNLYCVVGRRSLTTGLFLDRRSFLHSYDPGTDPEGNIIVKILSAIIPVCGGINLEYLFSRIDNSVYGAGTKLPHNVIGLLGVANGVEGDLRTGLPSQMIEVHEPARLLIVIEQTTELLDKAFAKLGDPLKEWLDNDWVRLAACHPGSRDLYFYHSTGWEAVELPTDCVAPSASHSESIIVGKTTTIPVHLLRRHA